MSRPAAHGRVGPLLQTALVLVVSGLVALSVGLYLEIHTVTLASLGAFLAGAAITGLDAPRPRRRMRQSHVRVPITTEQHWN